ncbi:MAG: hypothetical protein IKR39_02285 [Lachnospiraceae bacterium]|nr:hypothetical protein [Lachnospiraceae bacterium]
MVIIMICLCPLLCLLLLFKVRKNWLFSLLSALATLAVIAIEVWGAVTSSDFHDAAFAFQLFIPAQLITLALTLIIGNVVIMLINKKAKGE